MDKQFGIDEPHRVLLGIFVQALRGQFLVPENRRIHGKPVKRLLVKQGTRACALPAVQEITTEIPDKRSHLLGAGPILVTGQSERRHALHLGILEFTTIDGTERTHELGIRRDVRFLDTERMPQPLVRKKCTHVEEPRERVHFLACADVTCAERFRIESGRIDLRNEGIERAYAAYRRKVGNPGRPQLDNIREIRDRIGTRKGLRNDIVRLAPVEHAHFYRNTRVALELLHEFLDRLLRAEPVIHHPQVQRIDIGTAQFGHRNRRRRHQGNRNCCTHDMSGQTDHFASRVKSSKKWG